MRKHDPTGENLPDRLAEAYRKLDVGSTVALAVSGGADSVALLRATCEITERCGLNVCVLHLDHALRDESEAEARFVGTLTTELGVPARIERIDVREEAARTRRGIEETARRVRYQFFTRAAGQCGAQFVATAHTANDLAETVLFHALRGTGLRGLRGIPARRRLGDHVTLVRPLLDVTRDDIEHYLAALGQNFLTDVSNSDPAFTRNRLRHRLLPQLREAINPRLDEALHRLSRQANEASSLVAEIARKELKRSLIELTPGQIRLSSRRLSECPRLVIRETVALAWRRVEWPRQKMGFRHWEAIASIVIDGGRRSLPGGIEVRRRRGELILLRKTD